MAFSMCASATLSAASSVGAGFVVPSRPCASPAPRDARPRRAVRSEAAAAEAPRVRFTARCEASIAAEDAAASAASRALAVRVAAAAVVVAAAAFGSPTAAHAKAVYDHVDIQNWDFANNKEDLTAGIFDKCDATGSDFSHSDLTNATLSYGSFIDTNFEGANLTNVLGDRSKWEGANLKGTVWTNAIMTGVDFSEVTSVEGADFTGAMLDQYQYSVLCDLPSAHGTNPTTGEDTRASLGCE